MLDPAAIAGSQGGLHVGGVEHQRTLRGKIHISDAELATPDWLIDAFEGTAE